MLHESEWGIFDLMKRIGGFLFAGSLSTVVIGLMYRRTTPLAPLVGFPMGAILYWYFAWHRDGVIYTGSEGPVRVHWLHLFAANALLVFTTMLLIRRIVPAKAPTMEASRITPDIDLHPWRYARWAGAALIAMVVAMYLIFSPLGIGSR
jgi:solute:Na+ symporter, SSS family